MSVKVDEKGNTIVTVPSGTTYTLRAPKGKDLVSVEGYLKANKDVGNLGLLMYLSALLSGIEYDLLLETDAEDIVALGEAVSSFRCFSKL